MTRNRDDYCPEDGPAFTKMDCGHWACCWDVDECGACREEAQSEAADLAEQDRYACGIDYVDDHVPPPPLSWKDW